MIFIADVVKGSILEKLFTWQYFEPVLFGSIGVLLLLLFIVLFLGKKDQKKKIEETKKLELSSLTDDNSVDAFKVEPTEEKAEVIEPEVVNEKVDDIPPVVIEDAPVMNMDTEIEEETPVVVEEPKEEEDTSMPDFEIFGKVDKPEEEIPEVAIPEVSDIPPVVSEDVNPDIPVVDDVVKSVVAEDEAIKNDIVNEEKDITDEKIESFKENFADLASSISKELEEINRMQQESAKEEKEEIKLPEEAPVTSINEATKFTPTDVFSSVYSPNEVKEEDKPALKEETEIELPKKEELDNPFADDMPAIKTEKEEEKTDAGSVNTPDFSSFGNETFDIK